MAEPPLIFISHARVDARLTDAIATMITGRGLRPWVDRQRLAGGQQWAAELERAIHDCAAFVLVLTPAALRSDYVRREYLFALALHKPIILVRLQSGGPMPPELQAFPIIDLTKGRQKGLIALTATLLERGIVGTTIDAFDNDGIVALALFGHALPNWSVFRVSQRSYIVASLWQMLIMVITIFFASYIQYNQSTLTLPVFNQISMFVSIALYLVTFVNIALFAILVFALFGRVMPEIVVVTPDGIAHRVFEIYRSSAKRYIDFASVVDFTARRNVFGVLRLRGQIRSEMMSTPGNLTTWQLSYRPTLIPISTMIMHAIFGLVRVLVPERPGLVNLGIPWRFGATKVITQNGIVAYENFRTRAKNQASAVMSTQTYSMTPTVKRDSSVIPVVAMMAIPKTIAIIAAPTDRVKAQRLVDELQQRGYATQLHLFDAHIMIPAADVVLLALSPAALSQLPIMQFLHSAARIIPVLLQRLSQLPPEIASLQWVDLAQGDAQRNLYNLLYTLDVVGIAAATPSATLWADMVLTRDMRGQALATWHSYHAQEEQYRLLRRRFLSRFVRNLGILLLLVPTYVIVISVSFHYLSTIPLYVICIVLTILFAGSFAYVNQRQAHLMKELLEGRLIPEAIIITPKGFVVRARQRWSINTTAFAFQDITTLHLSRFVSLASLSSMQPHMSVEVTTRGDGRKVSVALPSIILNQSQAGADIVAAFEQFQKAAHQTLAQ